MSGEAHEIEGLLDSLGKAFRDSSNGTMLEINTKPFLVVKAGVMFFSF